MVRISAYVSFVANSLIIGDWESLSACKHLRAMATMQGGLLKGPRQVGVRGSTPKS